MKVSQLSSPVLLNNQTRRKNENVLHSYYLPWDELRPSRMARVFQQRRVSTSHQRVEWSLELLAWSRINPASTTSKSTTVAMEWNHTWFAAHFSNKGASDGWFSVYRALMMW